MYLFGAATGHLTGKIILLLFTFLLASHNATLASPAYNRMMPPLTENLDPAEANPEANITCLGDSYDLNLPVVGNFNPNRVSMHKLCAKPQFKGGEPGQHLGGFCVLPPHAGMGTTGEVSFDSSNGAQINFELFNPRVILGCFYRCFCSHGVADVSIQPKTKHNLFRTFQQLSRRTYELQIDIVDDFTVPRAEKKGKLGNTVVNTVQVSSVSEVGNALNYGGNMLQGSTLSLDPGNKIECRGDLPTFLLPSPYQTSDFSNLQQMCATQLSGGLA